MATEFQERARRLRNAVEPVAAGVYFAPEAHAEYAALGFEAGPSLASKDGIERPELKSYFTSRGASLGHVPGEVVAAAFGCFNPKVVVPAVAAGWRVTNRDDVLAARERVGPRDAHTLRTRFRSEPPSGRPIRWSLCGSSQLENARYSRRAAPRTPSHFCSSDVTLGPLSAMR